MPDDGGGITQSSSPPPKAGPPGCGPPCRGGPPWVKGGGEGCWVSACCGAPGPPGADCAAWCEGSPKPWGPPYGWAPGPGGIGSAGRFICEGRELWYSNGSWPGPPAPGPP